MNEIYKNRSDNPQPRKPRAVRRIRQPNSCAPSELTGRQVYLDGTAVSPCEPLEPNPPIPPRAPEKDVFTGKKYKPKRDSKIYPRIKKQLPARKSKKAKIIGAVAAFLIFAAAVTVSITKGLKFYKKETCQETSDPISGDSREILRGIRCSRPDSIRGDKDRKQLCAGRRQHGGSDRAHADNAGNI